LATDPVKVGADATRAPLEGMVVNELPRLAVLPVALRLRVDGPYHLRMAVVAALLDVDIAPEQLKRCIRLNRRDSRNVRLDKEGRNDLEEGGHRHRHGNHH